MQIKSISSDELHIWLLPAEDRNISPLSEQAASTVLKGQDLARYKHFKVERKKLEFLFSRLLLRHLLDTYFAGDKADITTTADELGRPYWIYGGRRLDLFFSLSHTRDFICCAVSREEKTGCDIELIRPRGSEQRLAEKVFSAREHQFYLNLAPQGRRLFFYRSWTLKEAYVKAVGQGLRVLLRSLDFTHLVPPGEPVLIPPDRLGHLSAAPPSWMFLSQPAGGSHIFSCATMASGSRVTFFTTDTKTLYHNAIGNL
ncbi:4'-phosphopantetheinyl transferase family protein [Desulforhopalus singaporensis]|uniref:4'-phosphopantetheinyl transferase n=1 Tax=Desulforhopalus singaporensis TaxID=91360 RepID=A0A1H0TZH7_9BACT|nr:4'-phosphopantetheinyl transferase superfamily protein [Desulforhopalus singaporensis]SDP59165.1 4'-phosphopantetheinyl transferase [Desulforhopalus singaporensis]